MNCRQIRHWIEVADFRPDETIAAHLETCELCREWFQEGRLLAALRRDPVPAPSPGFADRVVAEAIRQGRTEPSGRTQLRLGVAAAVSLVVAGLLAWLLAAAPRTAPAPAAPQMVNVVIDANAYRRGALLTLELSDELELDGYGEQRRIEWRTDLKKGRNLLSLPVKVRPGSDRGDVRVALSYDGSRATEMRIPVGT